MKIVVPEGVNRFTTSEGFISLIAMAYAKHDKAPTREAAEYYYSYGLKFGIIMSPWEMDRLPLAAESLMDADRYGYRGKACA